MISCFISAILHYTKHMHVPVPRGCWMSHNGVFNGRTENFLLESWSLRSSEAWPCKCFSFRFRWHVSSLLLHVFCWIFRQIAIPIGVLTSNTGLGCEFFGRCGASAGCHEFSAIGKCNTQKQGPQKMQNTKTRKNALVLRVRILC